MSDHRKFECIECGRPFMARVYRCAKCCDGEADNVIALKKALREAAEALTFYEHEHVIKLDWSDHDGSEIFSEGVNWDDWGTRAKKVKGQIIEVLNDEML